MMRGANMTMTAPWSLTLSPEGEQPIQKDDDMTLDDYYESMVTVHAEDTKTVDIKSGNGNPVWLLVIEPKDDVDQADNALTCKFSGTKTEVKLDKTLALVGQKEWKLLSGALDGAPQGLEFTNNTKKSVDVKV